MIDYETLRIIWWALLGTLLIGFAVMDGFDLGVAMLVRVLGHDDDERRVLLETIEPVWEGNQVWFILGGGAVFAAWPLVYAAAFSGLYAAMFLLLLAFIVRPVGFGYRNKIADLRWRNAWDWVLTISGLVPALIFGVAFGNLFLGLPFRFDGDMRMSYEGGFFGLLRPFALLTGLTSIAMIVLHGAAYAAQKTDPAIAAARATRDPDRRDGVPGALCRRRRLAGIRAAGIYAALACGAQRSVESDAQAGRDPGTLAGRVRRSPGILAGAGAGTDGRRRGDRVFGGAA